MTIEEKIQHANNVRETIRGIDLLLDKISKSREKADKKKGIDHDSYPKKMLFIVSHCTGHSLNTIGDNYGEGISDPLLLAKMLDTVEPLLRTEKDLLETELRLLFK